MSRYARYRRPATLLALLSGLLAGCGGGNEVRPLELQIIDAGRQIIAERRGGRVKIARPALTRAALDTVKRSAIEVTLERRDIFAYLFIDAERRDSGDGKITVWRSEDNVSLAMRNGILIATRGLGGDVLSSTVQVSGDAPGPAASGAHVQRIRTLDNKERALTLSCDLVDLGPEIIEIVELKHPTRHLQQRCEGGEGDDGQVVNDYWVDSRAGLIWQSRQWAGPYIGYMRLRRLTN